jgi:hypothetical protein
MKLSSLSAVLMISVSLPVVGGCSMLGGGGSGAGEGPRPAPVASGGGAVSEQKQLNTECARLQPMFNTTEADLTKPTLETGLKAEMGKWDKNADGELTNAELQPLNASLRDLNVGASPVTDWNGDGKVNFQEFASGWRTMFALCDRNQDEMVSYRELGYSPGTARVKKEAKPPDITGNR